MCLYKIAEFKLYYVQFIYINFHSNRTKKMWKTGRKLIYDLQVKNEFHCTEFYEIQKDRIRVL